MTITKRLFLAQIAGVLSFGSTALAAESAAMTNYKQEVEKIIDTWVRSMNQYNPELTKLAAQRDALDKETPRSPDYERRKKALNDQIASVKASMDLATRQAEVDLGLLKFPAANKSEGEGVIAFVKEVISRKGIPLTNNLSFRPTGNWNWGSNTGTLGLKFNYQSKWF